MDGPLCHALSKAQTRKLLRLCQAGSCDDPPHSGGGEDPARVALKRALDALGGEPAEAARGVRGPGRETLPPIFIDVK